MPSIAKPLIPLAPRRRNDLGLSPRDYEGAMSTLCAGCGHDSVTAALVQALFELSIPPYKVAKLSGIGCSSKTTAYFAGEAHGFNSVHGRMPTIATGANAANRELYYVGVSGDGDSLSIGLGHLAHAVRRNVRMIYVIENNGVYGLTKGQFSASSDIGSLSKKGEANAFAPIDPLMMALSIGATFVARGFSGDKERLVPLLKAGLSHRGLALIDVISPCVQFNDHEGSTKSYRFVREHEVTATDFVPPREQIIAHVPDQGVVTVPMHDGSLMSFRAVPEGYDPADRLAAVAYLQERRNAGEVVTGLVYASEEVPDLHELSGTPPEPLASLPFDRLCPGADALATLQAGFR
jgi:2-oxoglutarate/2-oxoacid ferredoxin oxidoreductase subunit beta